MRQRKGLWPEVNIIPVGASRCTPRPDNAAIVRARATSIHSSVSSAAATHVENISLCGSGTCWCSR